MCAMFKEQMMLYGLFVLCALYKGVSCDYKCVCSYTVERGVYVTPSNDSNVMGYMYEFDCKPVVTKADNWFTVAFEHKLGYVEEGSRLEEQTCPGVYPDADNINSSSTTTTASPDSVTSNTNSYTIDALVPSVSAALNTTVVEKTTTVMSTTPATTRVTSPTTTTVRMTTATTVRVTQSAFQACEVLTHQSNTAFASNEYCYELVTHHITFHIAEEDCRKKGGHLAHIKNDQEQQFITANAKHDEGDHYIWIGLHDTAHEEHFEWTSGEPLSYTHWYPGRKDFFLHGLEDCVALKIGNFVHVYDGAWEDLPCNKAHAYVCQFDLRSNPQIIG